MANSPSDIVRRADERAKEKALQIVLRHILNQTRRAGIPDRILDLEADHFESYLDHPWYQSKLGIDAMDVFMWVWNNADKWARSGSVLYIDGGSREHRNEVAMALLSKAIKANAYITTTIGKVINYLEILALWNSFNDERFELRQEMMDIPVLVIEEISLDTAPRDSSDTALFFDSCLIKRMRHCPTTILTIGDMAALEVKQGKSACLGRTFEYIKNGLHSPDNKIIKIRLEDK